MIDIKSKLNSKRRFFLLDILKSQNRVSFSLEELSSLVFNDKKYEDIKQLVIDEFCKTGLNNEDEPNERGLLIEDLLDNL